MKQLKKLVSIDHI